MLSPATILPILVIMTSLAFSSVMVAAHPPESLTRSFIASRATNDCNTICAAFAAVQKQCITPQCGCTISFLQAQGECLLCQARTPGGEAAVQFQLDAETEQCHSEGINVNFRLRLPPAAAAIVQELDHESERLRQQQTIFLALQISGGHVGLVIPLLWSIFSRKVYRDATFFNFCVTWIFSSVVFSLMLYRGTEGNTVVNSLGGVSPDTCLAQAAFTTGAQVMTACSTMALVIQFWLGLRTTIHHAATNGPTLKEKRWRTIALLVAPYILFFSCALPAILVGRQPIIYDGQSLAGAFPFNFYCTVLMGSKLNSFVLTVYGVTLVLLLTTVVFDVLIITMLYNHWRTFRHSRTKSTVPLSTLLRVIIFSMFRAVVATAYGSILGKPPTPQISALIPSGSNSVFMFTVPVWVDMLQAALPLVGFLVLGINGEMITALIFWRNKPSDVQNLDSVDKLKADTEEGP